MKSNTNRTGLSAARVGSGLVLESAESAGANKPFMELFDVGRFLLSCGPMLNGIAAAVLFAEHSFWKATETLCKQPALLLVLRTVAMASSLTNFNGFQQGSQSCLGFRVEGFGLMLEG